METFVDSDFSTIFLNLHKVRPISTSSRNVCQNILFPFLSQAAKQPKANTWRNSGTVKARYGPTRDVFLFFFSTHRAKSKTPCQKTPDTDVRYQFYVSSDSVKFLQFLILTRFIKPRLAQNCVAFFAKVRHVWFVTASRARNVRVTSSKSVSSERRGAIFHHQSAPIKERC